MNYHFLLLIFSLFISSLAVKANDFKTETELVLGAMKSKEVENLIVSSDLYKTCLTDSGIKDTTNLSSDDKTQLKDCFQKQINNLDAKEIQKLSNSLELKSFDKEASKTTASIKDYLQKRLSKALYGDEEDIKSFKDRKFVNHQDFISLYLEQIGKNSLLEISRYCIENLGLKDDRNKFINFNYIEGDDGKKFLNGIFAVNIYDANKKLLDDATLSNTFVFNEKYTSIKPNISHAQKLDFDLNDLKEYKICTDTEAKNDTKNICRTSKVVSDFINSELVLSKLDPAKKLIKDRSNACFSTVVKNMCLKYRCHNTSYASTQNGKEQCEKILGSNFQPDSKNTDGQKACVLMDKLSEYRRVVKLSKELLENEKKNVSTSGIKYSDVLKADGIFRSKGKNTFDRLTSISSKEMTEKVAALKNSKEEIDELKARCGTTDETTGKWTFDLSKQNDKECQKLVNSLDQNSTDSMELHDSFLKAAEVKKIKDLEAKDLKQFLADNGMDHYLKDEAMLDKILNDPTKLQEFKDKISAEFESRKSSVLSELREKYNKMKIDKNSSNQDQEITDLANNRVEELENHKERLESLYKYSNIVNSYLTISTTDDKKTFQNLTGRQIELNDRPDDELLTQYYTLDGDSVSSSGNGATSIDYIQVLDTVLDTSDPKESDD